MLNVSYNVKHNTSLVCSEIFFVKSPLSYHIIYNFIDSMWPQLDMFVKKYCLVNTYILLADN